MRADQNSMCKGLSRFWKLSGSTILWNGYRLESQICEDCSELTNRPLILFKCLFRWCKKTGCFQHCDNLMIFIYSCRRHEIVYFYLSIHSFILFSRAAWHESFSMKLHRTNNQITKQPTTFTKTKQWMAKLHQMSYLDYRQ